MFDIGWSEMLIVAAVTLIVLGPKDLPVLMRTIGRYAGMAKRQVKSFQAQIDSAVRDADLDLVRKEMEAIRKTAEAGPSVAAEPTKGAAGLTGPEAR